MSPAATAEKATLDLSKVKKVHLNLTSAQLVELAVARGEGKLADNGALVCMTGARTGRSPNDKFIVKEPSSESKVWWGKVNKPIEESKFEALKAKVGAYLGQKELFVQDLFLGADPATQVAIRVVTENAWHALFARQLFIRPEPGQTLKPEVTVLHAPSFKADPKTDGTNSDAFVILHFGQKTVILGGTQYAGEIKKSMFTLMNYLLPQRGIMSMHAAANVGKDGVSAIFFGLSGTGKTSLSADPERNLVGDDEHGWNDQGVFNFEGGCYAKCIRLNEKDEPQIYHAIKFGSVVENVVFKDEATRELDFDSEKITENTRVAYPLHYVDNTVLPSRAGQPKNIVFLTCDAFGVLPPISKLTAHQAMYHFLSGYTAKVAGTEAGVTEPTATFSTCFGAPFMALHPTVYAELLKKKLGAHGVDVWLVNTGWSGGPYGVGKRMKIGYTRAMVRAALDGSLAKVPTKLDPIFGVAVPTSCPGVPAEVLDPKSTWKDGAAYDKKAKELAGLFKKNFEQFAQAAGPDVTNAGPKG